MHKKIKILAREHVFEGAVLRALFAVFIVLIFAYLYFVGTSILNIIARKEAVAESAKIATLISNYERDYFATSGEMTPSSGVNFGLSPVSSVAYIYRPGAVGIATTNDSGI